MCLLCAAAPDERDLERRVHVLGLLALVEQPDTLPADASLRLAHEIRSLFRADGAIRRCDDVTPPSADLAANLNRRPS